MLRTCGAFTEKEIGVCLEIADLVLEKPSQSDYDFVVALDPDPAGFVVWGPNACAEGVTTLYWIVSAKKGVGTELIGHMESRVGGSRMCVLETSGKPGYDRQRRFYEKLGFRVVARVHDYYRPGDDLVMYRKDYLGS
jgi:GNAT superfamily N-acetyltransferase